MSFTSTKNEMKAVTCHLVISLYVTIVSVSLLRGDSTAEVDPRGSETLCESGGHVCNGFLGNNDVKRLNQIPPDYAAAVLPSLATQMLATVSPSRQIPTLYNRYAPSDRLNNALTFKFPMRSFLHRPGEWSLGPHDGRFPNLNTFWNLASRDGNNTAPSRHKRWLSRVFGQFGTQPTQPSSQGIVGWPTR